MCAVWADCEIPAIFINSPQQGNMIDLVPASYSNSMQ